jgi:hypothetical protein
MHSFYEREEANWERARQLAEAGNRESIEDLPMPDAVEIRKIATKQGNGSLDFCLGREG